MELPGIIWDAATCLFSCGKVHAAYVYKLEENLVSLQSKWDDLKNIDKDVRERIDDAEAMGEMKRTNEVNAWFQKVQNIQKVMEDLQAQGSQEIHNRCLNGCCPKNCVSSYKLGKKVVKKLSKVDELVTSGKHFLDKNVNITYRPPFKQVNEMLCVETVGLDLMLNKVWNSLEDENVGTIGLYGMGGAGKTTLMKKINNEFGKKKHDFALVLWVVVSRDSDIHKIMNDIRNRLGIDDDMWNKSSQHERENKIYQVLKQKKFVLMLDDLWEQLELERVGVPLPRSTNNQSKVLFTTRSKDVCAKMQAQEKFKVECLSEQEAFDLFCKKVGEETLKCHGEIPKLAWEIAKECEGLPLALITVGSAMAGVNSVDAWRQAKSDLRSSPFIASDLEEKVFCILKFSYDRLPNETHKSCFLYCALYPEDYEVEVDGLIYRWIGEGFLRKDRNNESIYDIYEQGKCIIEKLRLSCLLEGATSAWNEDWGPTIKMHDVIRDMALWLAHDQDRNKDKVLVQSEALVTSEMDFERLNVVERISITNIEGLCQVPACPNLSTLSVHGTLYVTNFSNFQSMSRLKVLDLSVEGDPGKRDWLHHLPKEIGKLINLEFLNLSRRKINGRLPVEFMNLKKLRIFLMEYVQYDLDIIPLEVIESLERLKVFRFHGTVMENACISGEEVFLQKLESLPELEELCIGLRTITGLEKLLESNKLRGCLRYFLLYEIEDPLKMPSLLASLSGMKHLDRISLIRVHNMMEDSSISDTCHLRNLRWVNCFGCDSITHLTWLRYAPQVEFLVINRCKSIEEIVKRPKGVDEDGGTDIFSNLRRLYLDNLPRLKSIHKRALAFPFLKSIHIAGCPNLRKLPLNSNSAKDSLMKIAGSTDWWNQLEWEDIAVKDLLQSKFRSPDG